MIAGIVTLFLLLLFLAGWIWAWQPGLKKEFDAAARMPLDDEEESAP